MVQEIQKQRGVLATLGHGDSSLDSTVLLGITPQFSHANYPMTEPVIPIINSEGFHPSAIHSIQSQMAAYIARSCLGSAGSLAFNKLYTTCTIQLAYNLAAVIQNEKVETVTDETVKRSCEHPPC